MVSNLIGLIWWFHILFVPWWQLSFAVKYTVAVLAAGQFWTVVSSLRFREERWSQAREVTLAEPFPKTLEFSLANKKQGQQMILEQVW